MTAGHEFTLFVERAERFAPQDLFALREHGCVLVTTGEDGRGVAVFEGGSGDWSEAVRSAIEAVEALEPGSRVTEIEGVPMPLPGLRVVTTLSREEFDDVDPS